MAQKYVATDSRVPKILKSLAERSFGIPISEDDLQRLEIVAQACGVADDEVDEIMEQEPRIRFMNEGVAYIVGESHILHSNNQVFLERMERLRVLYQTLSPDRQRIIGDALWTWTQVTERLRNVTDARNASKIRMFEGELNGMLFCAALSDAVRLHKNYPRFEYTVRKIARVANTVSLAYGLRDDYEHNRYLIKPTFFAHFILLWESFWEGFPVAFRLRFPTYVGIIKFQFREFYRRKTEHKITYR